MYHGLRAHDNTCSTPSNYSVRDKRLERLPSNSSNQRILLDCSLCDGSTFESMPFFCPTLGSSLIFRTTALSSLCTKGRIGAHVCKWLAYFSVAVLCQLCLFSPKLLPLAIRKTTLCRSTHSPSMSRNKGILKFTGKQVKFQY